MPILQIEDIKKMLPQRYPFLLLDRVLELEEGKRCKAVKNVTSNEPFFQGHFPGYPIMPGVFIVEAMAQACGIAIVAALVALHEDVANKWLMFAGIEKARFKRPVIPGDQLIIEAVYTFHKLNLWVFSVRATVDGQIVAQAEIRTAIVHKTD